MQSRMRHFTSPSFEGRLPPRITRKFDAATLSLKWISQPRYLHCDNFLQTLYFGTQLPTQGAKFLITKQVAVRRRLDCGGSRRLGHGPFGLNTGDLGLRRARPSVRRGIRNPSVLGNFLCGPAEILGGLTLFGAAIEWKCDFRISGMTGRWLSENELAVQSFKSDPKRWQRL